MQALCKSAPQEFLMLTPLANTYSQSDFIWTNIYVIIPSPVHIAEGKQTRAATKPQGPKNLSFLIGCLLSILWAHLAMHCTVARGVRRIPEGCLQWSQRGSAHVVSMYVWCHEMAHCITTSSSSVLAMWTRMMQASVGLDSSFIPQ